MTSDFQVHPVGKLWHRVRLCPYREMTLFTPMIARAWFAHSGRYASTKAFMTMFATSVAAEVNSLGIDVVVVHPSPMATNFFEQAEGKWPNYFEICSFLFCFVAVAFGAFTTIYRYS
jgi:NAD(P)-dependent dehydrogenase (short-subunit alcohol dehydrogenase family)